MQKERKKKKNEKKRKKKKRKKIHSDIILEQLVRSMARKIIVSKTSDLCMPFAYFLYPRSVQVT